MEKAIKYDYIYNAVKELYEDSWAAEHVAYRNMLDLICNIPEEEIVDIEKLVAKSVRPEGADESDFVYCPTCNEILGINESVFWAFEENDGCLYCPKCGQKLKEK